MTEFSQINLNDYSTKKIKLTEVMEDELCVNDF